jgi:hypothetical protein
MVPSAICLPLTISVAVAVPPSARNNAAIATTSVGDGTRLN